MACFERRHYVAAVNMFRVYERPADLFGRYLLHRGTYPATVRVRTPIGPLDLLIAGQAVARDLTLVSNNLREFRRIDKLRVEDWQVP